MYFPNLTFLGVERPDPHHLPRFIFLRRAATACTPPAPSRERGHRVARRAHSRRMNALLLNRARHRSRRPSARRRSRRGTTGCWRAGRAEWRASGRANRGCVHREMSFPAFVVSLLARCHLISPFSSLSGLQSSMRRGGHPVSPRHRFNGTTAKFASRGGHYVLAQVPARAASGPISIAKPNGSATSRRAFLIQ